MISVRTAAAGIIATMGAVVFVGTNSAQPLSDPSSTKAAPFESVLIDTTALRAQAAIAGKETISLYGDIYFYVTTSQDERYSVFDVSRENAVLVENEDISGDAPTSWEAEVEMIDVPSDAQLCIGTRDGLFDRFIEADEDPVIARAGTTSACANISTVSETKRWRLDGPNGASVSLEATIEPYTPSPAYVASNVIKYWKEQSGAAATGEANSPVVLAHRGLFGSYARTPDGSVPENSLAALRAAEKASIEGVEMDVRATADPSTPVIMHDSTLGRTTNVFDPSVSPNPPAEADLAAMTKEILDAGGVALPPSISERDEERLTWTLTPDGAFSPYPRYDKETGFGTAYGRNPLVTSLSPEVITNLNLLNYRDVANPAPPLLTWNDKSYVQTKADVSKEKVPTVQDILDELATMENPPVVVFDILQNQSLEAVAKIIADDTRQYAYNMEAKDLVVLKYRGNIAPDLDKTIADLKTATTSDSYPNGFVPNLVGIVAPYMKRNGFDPEAFERKWIEMAKADPQLPLIGLDIVQTSPVTGPAPLLDAAYKAKVSVGSFHDVPSYHGGPDLYPRELVDRKLFLWQPGTCCRTSYDSGYPDGTRDLRFDYTWLIGRPTDSTAVNSGMITSDDSLTVIDELERRGLRAKATAAYSGDGPADRARTAARDD